VLPAIESGAVRALSLGPKGVFRQWSAATLKNIPEPPHISEFIKLLAAQSLPAQCVRHRIA